jgi:hypothetical protein
MTALRSAVHALLASNEPTLQILGVSGPGGIGKTWAVNAALADFNLLENGIIKIALDGSDQGLLTRPVEFIAQYLTPPQLPEPALLAVDHFPKTRAVVHAFRTVCDQASKDEKILDLIKQGHEFIKPLIEKGGWLSDAPWYIKKGEQPAFELTLAALKKYQGSRSLLSFIYENTEDAVKRDLNGTLSESIIVDFKAMMVGFAVSDPQKYTKFTERKINGCTKVLIVLDDYEMLHQVMGDLLLGKILPGLAQQPLPIRMIIIGRDELSSTDVKFGQYFAKNIVGQYPLHVMTREDVTGPLIKKKGYTEAEAEAIYQETGGYPYLVGHYLEHDRDYMASAVGAKSLYDRTVKWMMPEQRKWVEIVVKLDAVSIASIQGAGFAEEEAKHIFSWFENEPSLRDPRAPVFTVNRLLRTHILRYLQMRTGTAAQ